MSPLRRFDPAAIQLAARLLLEGRLVAFPTETVYGLGAVATNEAAVAAIFAAKGRPACNPLIVHLPGRGAALPLAVFDERALRATEALWPGPLTLVLAARAGNGIATAATAGLPTLALRVPDHPIARDLLLAVGRPVAAPSANRSGRLSPTSAEHVTAELGNAVALVLDGGPCSVGVESTVLDLSDPNEAKILRPGGVPPERLAELLGSVVERGPDPATPSAPGQLASHYAPSLQLRLDAIDPGPDEAFLAFGPEPAGLTPAAVANLSPAGDVAEAARNLFAMLRDLDRSGASRIAVMPISGDGLGAALRDRLRRAAAPRGD